MVVKRKKIIITLIIFMICIIIILTIRGIIYRKNTLIFNEVEVPEGGDYFDSSKIKKVGDRSDYILVKKCIEKYFNNLSDSEFTNKILADEYIKLHNVSIQNNIEQKTLLDNFEILINNMYVTEIGLGVFFYNAKGGIINTQTSEIQEFELGVMVDNSNRTYGIIPEEYLVKMGYSGLNENSKIKFKEINKIKNKGVNTFKYRFINEDIYVLDYLFPDFINKCLLSANIAYQHLDDEYKEKKFGSVENFAKYIEKNEELYGTLNPANMKQPNDFDDYDDYISYLYSYTPFTIVAKEKKNMGNYLQYVLEDNFGKYYIFKEKGILNYKVILDTYTIDIPEFIKQYMEGDTKTKIALNTQKIVDALNDGDYKYVYSKLADSFKANYFNTLESFEEYAKNTFGTNNEVEYKKFIETANYCTLDVTFKNKKWEITKTVIMQLQEDTNFVMSFNVD